MKRWFCVVAFAAVCAAQTGIPEDVLHLARVRGKMRASLANMPDFVCLATTDRFRAPKPGHDLVPADTIRMEVAEIGGKELYSWPGKASFASGDAADVVRYGLVGSGDFSAHAIDAFEGGFAVVHYAGPEQVDRRPALRWDYNVPFFGSGWTLHYADSTATVAAEGSFWADPATEEVLRLRVSATEIPPRFPIAATTLTIDYARVEIGGKSVILPQRSERIVVESNGRESVNRTEFSQCRQYAATATVSFDADPARAASPAAPSAPSRETTLPAGLALHLELERPLRSEGSALGDPVLARIVSDVRVKDTLVIPRGSLVHGRLRQMTFQKLPIEAWQVGLEFSTIDLPDSTARFYASLRSVDTQVDGLNWTVSGKTGKKRVIRRGNTLVMEEDSVAYLDPIPGVGNFFINGSRVNLAKGLLMTWLTEDLSRKK